MADFPMNGRGYAPQAGSYQAYQGYQQPQHPAPQPSGNPVKAVAALTGAGLSLALLIGVGVWSYQLIARDVAGVPVVRAVQGEMRIRPADPGGAQALNQGLAVNNVAAAGGTAGPSERIVLAPEPIDLSSEDAPLIDKLAAGHVPVPGPQNGRYTSEPLGGLTSLKDYEKDRDLHNASVRLAVDIGDTVKRIDGTEVPLLTPWRDAPAAAPSEPTMPAPATTDTPAEIEGTKPQGLDRARDGQPDDLKLIKGIGPALETLCHRLGFFHFDQIAAWTAAEIEWVDSRLKFKGRIVRDDWVGQAKALAASA